MNVSNYNARMSASDTRSRRPPEAGGGWRLFVYGTLMRGEVNAHHLVSARPVGPARTIAAFTLVALQGYPGLRPGGTTSVKGELYLVDAGVLAALDEFEGHPTLFRRSRISLAGGGEAEAYLVPEGQGWGAPVIVGGDWRARPRVA